MYVYLYVYGCDGYPLVNTSTASIQYRTPQRNTHARLMMPSIRYFEGLFPD